MRGAIALIRRRDPALLGALVWWACDILVLWAALRALRAVAGAPARERSSGMTVGYRPPSVSATPPQLTVADAMSDSSMYLGRPEVTVRETHSAWVFLAGESAYKVKKPVRMAFLDFSTLERRRAVCHEEVRVNAPLAASLDMRVRAVVAQDGAYVLADAGAPDAVEYAIEMRRFDEERTMASLIRRGELRDHHLRAVARRLAE